MIYYLFGRHKHDHTQWTELLISGQEVCEERALALSKEGNFSVFRIFPATVASGRPSRVTQIVWENRF